VQPDQLKQAATVVAALAYLTAQRDSMLPRRPLPAAVGTRPGATGSK
jgi:hypothetical protein